ncbi:unnamed protein product [Arabidopsis thaliana]|uniref:Uncharacterized protein n=2 Tax=Arabidopsis thaliana TaxID=3702 RepID=A0A654FG90_ARATH|nr:uncharacterized protein AT3G26355 [Arabidopsis thaliana]ANM64497.1 hypothetical protein AT3G26355 [Arabidopsis thaliana]CAA0383750.1 unnamed protein product [Arabidopsis thaliana]VYS58672.1 unnamed protein product [Arabidopsis thaliana]|eukprot:NP_001336526.1 hypothetical protein AT3G26355 [Arabidopsis thaliana]
MFRFLDWIFTVATTSLD